MKKSLIAVLMTAFLLLPLSQAIAAPRTGVVVEMQPIENRGDDLNQTQTKTRKLGRAFGNLVGLGAMAAGKGGYGTAAAATVSGDVGEQVAKKYGPQGEATRYMVKVKLNNGKTMSLTPPTNTLNGIKVGSKVMVDGSGAAAQIYLAH